MRLQGGALLIVSFAASGSAALAAPAPAATSLGTSLSRAVTDGKGTIATVPVAGTIRLLTGTARPVDVDVRDACLEPPTLLLAAGSGQIRRAADGATEVLDVDRPELVNRLCAPLERDERDEDFAPRYADFFYHGRYGVSAPSAYEARDPALVMRRCGSAVSTVLARGDDGLVEHGAAGYAPPVTVGAGVVSWLSNENRGTSASKRLPRAHAIRCRRTFTWPGSALVRVSHVADAVVVSRSGDEGRTWRIERRSLDGACERSAAAERLTLAGGGKRVAAGARSGMIADAASGATTTVKRATARARTLRVRAGAPIRVTTGAPAASVRWGVAGGRTRRASGRGRSWKLAAPAKPGTRPLRVIVRDRAGGSVTFAARVTTTRR